ncbi:MAG TPA: hydrogenase 4 subunit B [Chloroflexota bacterium]|nr:hydrogenase 4 subunit B [Chloroflexota bacterium]
MEPAILGLVLAPYITGIVIGAFAGKRAVCVASHAAAAVGGVTGTAVAAASLLSGWTVHTDVVSLTPFATFALRLDPLAAYFLLVISVVATAVALFASAYVNEPRAAGLAMGFNAFLASMVLVVLANSVITFLIAWELMSLVSFFLVIHDHERKETRRAGFLYLVMTHAGTAFLLAAFLILFRSTGSLSFDAFRAAASNQPNFIRDAAFVLALIGFGTKAGVIPLHIWLPRAHPAAPSHVSALMSGVMIKTAIYGLLRVGWEFVGPGPAWWGVLILAVGSVSAVLGVLYALMEHDLKRLLAYHSVENIGIILMGVGSAFLLASQGHTVAAALALSAGLFHTLNHAVFKSLLFLATGAVQHATHTRNMDQLGGLIRGMPWTAGFFLIGSIAISGLPPLNGFASEWLTFQGLLQVGSQSTSGVLAVAAGIAAALLALTGGLAAFCFVKAFGITFLGMPRSASHAGHEAALPMLAGTGLLASLCFVLGVLPGVVLRLISPVTSLLAGAAAPDTLATGVVGPPSPAGVFAPGGILVLVAVFGLGVLLLARILAGPGVIRVAPPWACGIQLEPGMQYTSTALAKPIRLIFQALVRPYRDVEREYSQAPFFVSSVRYEGGVVPVYEHYLYRPAVKALLGAAHRIRLLQNGSLRTYLAYMFAALLVAILMAR